MSINKINFYRSDNWLQILSTVLKTNVLFSYYLLNYFVENCICDYKINWTYVIVNIQKKTRKEEER